MLGRVLCGALGEQPGRGGERGALPLLLYCLPLGALDVRDRVNEAVEAFVRGEAFGAYGGPLDFHGCPQYRPVVAVGGAARDVGGGLVGRGVEARRVRW